MRHSLYSAFLAILLTCTSAIAETTTDENALPQLKQASLFLKEGKKNDARDAFEKCLQYKLSPEHESYVKACLANLVHETDKEKAFEYLKDARKLDPKNTSVLPALGSHYAQKGDYATAKECINEYLKAEPDSPNAASVKELLEQVTKIEEEREVLKKLNSAITLSNEHKYNEAIAVLEEIQKKDHAHKEKEDELLGVCYKNVGKYKQAIEIFKRALDKNPKQPAVVSALAGAYEGMGDLKQARECLKKYLQMDHSKDSTDMRMAAKDRMPVLKKVMKQGGDADAPDYFEAVSKPKINRWSLTKMPLKVYIEPGDNVKNFQKAFNDSIGHALDLWCLATNGKISWAPTTIKEESHIDVLFTADAAEVARTESHSEAGVCHTSTIGRKGAKIAGIKHATIKMLTTNDHNNMAFTPEEIEATASHEVGHALGMSGHSSNPNDAMFFAATKNIKEGLTSRDAKTLKYLYAARVFDDGTMELERDKPEEKTEEKTEGGSSEQSK